MKKTADSTVGKASRRREFQRLIRKAGGSMDVEAFKIEVKLRGFDADHLIDHLQPLGLVADSGHVYLRKAWEKKQNNIVRDGERVETPDEGHTLTTTELPDPVQPSQELESPGAYNSDEIVPGHGINSEPGRDVALRTVMEPTELFPGLETNSDEREVALRVLRSVMEEPEGIFMQLSAFISKPSATQMREIYAQQYAYNYSIQDGCEWGKFMQMLAYIKNPKGQAILGFLIKNGAATSLELEKQLSLPQYTVSRKLRDLMILDVIEQTGMVRSPYVRQRRGAKIKIFRMADVGPEAVLEAQRRYSELVNKTVEDVGQESIIDAYTEKVLRAVEAEGLTGEKLAPVYAIIGSVKIPEELRDKVKTKAINAVVDMQAAKQLEAEA